MNTLIIHFQHDDWSPLDAVVGMGGTLDADTEASIQRGEQWLKIFSAPDVLGDYDPHDLRCLNQMISVKVSFMVEWRGEQLLIEFLEALPHRNDIVIDNDLGVLIPFDLIRHQPLHDWIAARRVRTIGL